MSSRDCGRRGPGGSNSPRAAGSAMSSTNRTARPFAWIWPGARKASASTSPPGKRSNPGSGLLFQLRRAVRAADRGDGDGRGAEGAILGRRRGRLGLPFHPVHAPDEEKDRKGDDEEADDPVDEGAV